MKKNTATMTAPLIQIGGGDVKTIGQMQELIIAILNSKQEQATIQVALQTLPDLQLISNADHAVITNTNLTGAVDND